MANGSSEVYSRVNMVTVNGGHEAGKLVVSVMYNGLKVIPMDWFNDFVGGGGRNAKREDIQKWV